MKRIILAVSFVLAALAVTAWAEPTKEQLEQAKAAFAEGKSLHDQGKLPEAVEKFKESYRLSQNPLLLYNIGFTLDEAGQKDNALLYYRKFLSDAPANATQRKTVEDRVKAIEKEKLDADLSGKPGDTKPTDGHDTKTEKPVETKTTKIKPPGTYSDKDFQHQIIDTAPPGKPLDITAFVPEDSGWTVILNYRAAGDPAFIAKPMKWRYKELVARVPAAKMAGSSIQYYIDVKDQTGAKVAGSGKQASPNLVEVDAAASARFYPDWNDTNAVAETNGDAVKSTQAEDEDPLHPGQHKQVAQNTDVDMQPHDQPTTSGTSWTDPGSEKFEKAKWISTGTAGALLAGSLTFYILASKQADNIVADSKSCGNPPCRAYDHTFDQAWQDAGHNYSTLSNVTFVVGFGAAVVSGYLWYRQLSAKKHGELKMSNKNAAPETTWVVIPTGSPTGVGAAAAVEF